MMKYDTAKPLPVTLTDMILDMPNKKSVWFSPQDATPETVRTIVWRVRSKYKTRRYQTAKERDGIRVWRTA